MFKEVGATKPKSTKGELMARPAFYRVSPNNTDRFLRLAARVGRTYRDRQKHEKALARLRDYMADFGPEERRDRTRRVLGCGK